MVSRVTYIDADLWFLQSPKPIFDEFDSSAKHVLITDHSYSPQYDQSARSGQYCVQFMIFTRTGGELVRDWWEQRCLEWCYARYEDGKFGDQKYLDDWPVRFSNLVHVLEDRHLTLAPWNALRFPYSGAIFYHFHALRLISKSFVDVGNYCLPSPVQKYVYSPYLIDIRAAVLKLQSYGLPIIFQNSPSSILYYYISIFKRLWSYVSPAFQEPGLSIDSLTHSFEHLIVLIYPLLF